MFALYEENPIWHRCIIRKGKEMLTDFSDNTEYSSLILPQDLTSESFWKTNYNVDSGTIINQLKLLHWKPLVFLILWMDYYDLVISYFGYLENIALFANFYYAIVYILNCTC